MVVVFGELVESVFWEKAFGGSQSQGESVFSEVLETESESILE